MAVTLTDDLAGAVISMLRDSADYYMDPACADIRERARPLRKAADAIRAAADMRPQQMRTTNWTRLYHEAGLVENRRW